MDESMDIKPRLDYLIVCDAVGVGPDGRKTLYGVFDRLVFLQYPVVYPQCCIVTRWTYGSGKHKLRIRILDSDGNALFDPKGDLNFELKDPLSSAEIVLTLQNLRFAKPGTCTIEVTLDGQAEAEPKHLRFELFRPPQPPKNPS